MRNNQLVWLMLLLPLLLVCLSACSGDGSAESNVASHNPKDQENSDQASGEKREAEQKKEDSRESESSEKKEESAEEETEMDRTPKLFIIERSKNANIVRYDAQLTKDGKLNPEEPVVAYWILHADEGQRAELSWMQKKMAYGFETKPAPSGDGYLMKMVPLPKRELRIKKVDEAVQAQLEIDGKPAVLEKIYVDSDPGLTGPSVNYVKLFGKDLETGEKREEKIVPE